MSVCWSVLLFFMHLVRVRASVTKPSWHTLMSRGRSRRGGVIEGWGCGRYSPPLVFENWIKVCPIFGILSFWFYLLAVPPTPLSGDELLLDPKFLPRGYLVTLLLERHSKRPIKKVWWWNYFLTSSRMKGDEDMRCSSLCTRVCSVWEYA
jgi:hypothetical protein